MNEIEIEFGWWQGHHDDYENPYIFCVAERNRSGAQPPEQTRKKKWKRNISKNTKLKLNQNARRNENYFSVAKHSQYRFGES